MGYTEAFVNAD